MTPRKAYHSTTIRFKNSTFSLSVEVLWLFKDFAICVVLNLPFLMQILSFTKNLSPLRTQNALD